MSKTPKGKQANTLFSYFQKTPKSDASSGDVLSPRRSPNSDKASAKNHSSVASKGDVIWAKLEGFPWWPSLVCDHPTEKVHTKGGKSAQVHVQFFDTPPTRAWIKARNIKPFKGANDEACQKGGQFYSLNNKIRQGVVDADKALLLDVQERMKLVVELQPSSEEEDDEDEPNETIDFDPSVFNAEMSDDEMGTKENCESKSKECEEVGSPKKKQSKSPKKLSVSPQKSTKAKRKAAKEAEEKNKRRRLIKSESAEDDSEDDFKPDSTDDDDDNDSSSGEDEENVTDVEPESEPESPVKKSRKRKAPSTPASAASKKKPLTSALSDKKTPVSPSVSESTKSKLSLFSAPETTAGEEGSQRDASSFPHVRLDFLQPDKIKDFNRKLKSDPDYNPKTLYVPESFLDKQTPAMRQWWEMKTQHFDTILFFKVGKFYEFYNMDAAVGVQELGLVFMRGEYAHSGFPEIAYGRYSDALIKKGYKVARVEQTETPDMMTERCKAMKRMATKFDKVVKREICQVSTPGTRTYSHLDGDSSDTTNKYLLALCEKVVQEGTSSFGVCFIDTSIGTFHLGQFDDDRHLSRLRTLISHYAPVQVLYEKGKLSAPTLQLFNANLTSALKEALSSGSEFWDSGKTLKTLAEEDYFKSGNETKWPSVLKSMLSENDSLGLTADESKELAVRSLGAMIWYLQYCLLDQELLSMRKFEEYVPLDCGGPAPAEGQAPVIRQRHMVLDGVTMANLDVVWSSSTQSTEGTLLERMNHCTTASGKRLFHQWLCAPLCQPASISDRLDAVEDLMANPGVVEECVPLMKKLPDLERLLSRIHSLGSGGKNKNHPDNRAILFEEVKYSKRKIEDFLTTIEGFKLAVQIAGKFQPLVSSFKSRLLSRSVKIKNSDSDAESCFPDISDDLEFFDTSFDQKKAKKDGVIVPSKGVDSDYDAAIDDLTAVEKHLEEYLQSQKKALGCKSIVYWGTGKNRYQMEIPEAAATNVPNSYELMSSKKGAKRYRTAKINEYLRELTDAEERKDACLKDIMRRIFYSFDERHSKWISVVQCLSVLDVLISMTTYSKGGDGVMCRPEFVEAKEGTEPMLEIREGRHPCVTRTFEGGDFIPNDTLIGIKDEGDDEDGTYSQGQVVLVTGPNMGGKSTLMRQVGLITIMAQMGCYVPAAKCRLTPVDRIFTRLGASDRIMAGESTFFVELSETSSILQHATKHSLVLMDELGRGTATYDGTAIACAVVQELSENIKCRSLFSTHYHSLVEEFKHDTNTRLGHMACMVENENEDDPSQETITFLYKFVKGACPKSYGFNAARLASIPEEVIQRAVSKSKQFEHVVESHKMFQTIWSCQDVHSLQSLLKDIKC
ncbi:hypothetical protein BsWGS_14196 [Bradybaena similaris]